jgi:ABC-type nitrate/sulfonate/bicarbonate transport system substrate-binding protein
MAALLTAIVLAACTPPKPAQQFTLRIGTFSAPSFLPYFVMQEQGFDKKNGLQLVEKSYPGGTAIIEAVVAGSLDMGVSGTPPVLSAAERGLIPSKVIPVAANDFADPDHPGVGVLVPLSVTSWQDLKGQQIAINALNSINAAAVVGRLHQEGVRDYTLVEISFPNMGLAVTGGNVAAAAMAEPHMTQSLLRKDGKLLGWVAGGSPFERIELTMVIFSTDLYRNNPAVVKAFLRAQLQAVKWIDQNPEKARAVLAKRLAISPEVARKMKLLRFPLDARSNPALLVSMQPLLVDIGMVKAPIPVNKLYDETLLEEVLKERKK